MSEPHDRSRDQLVKVAINLPLYPEGVERNRCREWTFNWPMDNFCQPRLSAAADPMSPAADPASPADDPGITFESSRRPKTKSRRLCAGFACVRIR
jgi:hypothetical protein